MGIQPDFIVARSEKILDKRRIERFALFCNVQPENIISNPDVAHPYEVPLILDKQKVAEKILSQFKLKVTKPDLSDWKKLVDKIYSKKEKVINIAIVGKYFGTGDYQLKDSYAALFDALDHGAFEVGVEIKTHWIDAEKVEKLGPEIIGKPDGLIVPIGWGERGAEGMIAAASYARKNKIPYLGLCYGMQLAVIAFARDVLNWSDANTNENNSKTKHPVIHLMPAQKKYMDKRSYGGTMRLGTWKAKVKKDTKAFQIYGTENTSERHRHRYEFNDDFKQDFENKGLIISARSEVESLAEIIELPESTHPFYFGTQGHPEYKSRPLSPHPIFIAFLNACKNKK
jgi:CTP synthase